MNCKSQQLERSTDQVFNCPDKGICDIEVLEDTEVVVLKDEFGKSYLVENKLTGNDLLKVTYLRDSMPNVQDDFYKEEIYLNIKELKKYNKTQNFNSLNLIAGRLCFCRDDHGFKNIKNGQLEVINEDNLYSINLTIDEVTYLKLSTIQFKVKL
jgi:hypothetical protein